MCMFFFCFPLKFSLRLMSLWFSLLQVCEPELPSRRLRDSRSSPRRRLTDAALPLCVTLLNLGGLLCHSGHVEGCFLCVYRLSDFAFTAVQEGWSYICFHFKGDDLIFYVGSKFLTPVAWLQDPCASAPSHSFPEPACPGGVSGRSAKVVCMPSTTMMTTYILACLVVLM